MPYLLLQSLTDFLVLVLCNVHNPSYPLNEQQEQITLCNMVVHTGVAGNLSSERARSNCAGAQASCNTAHVESICPVQGGNFSECLKNTSLELILSFLASQNSLARIDVFPRFKALVAANH